VCDAKGYYRTTEYQRWEPIAHSDIEQLQWGAVFEKEVQTSQWHVVAV